MTTDNRLPHLLSSRPLIFSSPASPANSLFPNRSYRKVPRIPRLSKNKSDRFVSTLPDQPIEQTKSNKSPVRRTVVFKEPVKSPSESADAVRKSGNAKKHKKLPSITERYPVTVDKLQQMGLLHKSASNQLVTWDNKKILEHPMHKMLTDRIEKIHREEIDGIKYKSGKQKTDTLGIQLRTRTHGKPRNTAASQ